MLFLIQETRHCITVHVLDVESVQHDVGGNRNTMRRNPGSDGVSTIAVFSRDYRKIDDQLMIPTDLGEYSASSCPLMSGRRHSTNNVQFRYNKSQTTRTNDDSCYSDVQYKISSRSMAVLEIIFPSFIRSDLCYGRLIPR